eukprot:Gb_02187 [translate_table: standard]
MATEVVQNDRSGAEVFHGAEICYQKSLELLEDLGLPKGLLPLKDLEESGYVKETGFVWLKQRQPSEHYNKKIKRTVHYGTEITAYVEKYKMKKMTGVKSKELLLWIPITEMSVDGASSAKIYFKSSVGIGKSFPVKAFELENGTE